MERFSLILGDITESRMDAIVNAANNSLLGGGGVDGAIHRIAGPELLEACRPLGGCADGEAKLTAGFDLPAQYVIHTVGPVWRGGKENEAATLAACYRNSLALAAQAGCKTVDFPSISTGVFGYPLVLAATVALRAILEYLRSHELPEQVRMVCHNQAAFDAYRQAYNMWYAPDKAHRL